MVIQLLKDIQRKEEQMSQELDDLEVAVNENTSLDASIIQLVNGLAEQIEVLKDNPARLVALAASLRASSAAMAEAVQANTPQLPPDPEVPTE